MLAKFWQNIEQQNAKNNRLIKAWQNFAKCLSTLPLLEFWQKFDKNIVKKVPISHAFHEPLTTFCLLRFFSYHQFVLYLMTQTLDFWDLWRVFLCFVNTSDILTYSVCCLLYILSIFHFLFVRGMLEKWWCRNIICNETNISVILAINYFEIKSHIKMQQRAVSLNTEYLFSYNENYWRFQTVDNIEKMWDSNQLSVYFNGIVELATQLVMCIWIHMIFKVQTYVAFVLVSKILCVPVVHGRCH